ncbi:hypothetical protein D1164_18510 [Mariniphaga sediminis]|uniref:Glycosyl hydrolase family 92 domain-containing protein n=1 Tax=Mariniphaga sediminis TaxID=1628158 RepID=A0A399CWH5_9BACT|nr:glycoside hydrolase domain-containing protein [Mariniphaga sediminis]RIH63747.1 hypothetical protein D1164_18510 [Mariniphaga sediminis]
MKKLEKYFILLPIILLVLLFGSCSQLEGKRAVDYLDPFICTQYDYEQWCPTALVPFGLVELCPDSYPGSFDETPENVATAWNDILSRIQVKGKNEEDKTVFLCGTLPHLFLPVILSDVDVSYHGLDRKGVQVL